MLSAAPWGHNVAGAGAELQVLICPVTRQCCDPWLTFRVSPGYGLYRVI